MHAMGYRRNQQCIAAGLRSLPVNSWFSPNAFLYYATYHGMHLHNQQPIADMLQEGLQCKVGVCRQRSTWFMETHAKLVSIM